MSLPGLVTITQENKAILSGADEDKLLSITIDSSSSGGGSPSHRIEAGNVLGTKSDGTYIEASRYSELVTVAAPTLVSAEVPDADWASKVVKLYHNGLEVASITLGGGDTTLGEVVIALNGDGTFAKYAAASSDTNLRVTSLFGGLDHSISVSANLTTAFATISSTSSYQSAAVTAPIWAISAFPVDTQDVNGTATDAGALGATSGRFNTADLRNLTGQARAALQAQGCVFYT